MTAWVLWLVVWSLCPAKPLQTYLLSMAPVVLLTTAPWFASFVMPDILGPLVYLAFFLIAFLPRSLSRWESGGLLAIGFWGITSHSTHLLLAIIECLFFIVVWVFCRPEMRPALCGILRCAAVVMVAISSQFLIHFRLYGEASLFGHPPPFLTGRLLADGPARTYLQQNCLHSTWVLCAHLEALPLKENDFFGRRTVFG